MSMKSVPSLVSLVLAAIASVGLCDLARAELVPVKWDAHGHFVREFRIEPGKFVEACEKLSKGTQVAWRFQSAVPLNFNVHYHVGKDVRFPANQDQVAALDGTLKVELEQDYCWMWTNKSADAAVLQVTFERR
jgi:hypothetical protein